MVDACVGYIEGQLHLSRPTEIEPTEVPFQGNTDFLRTNRIHEGKWVGMAEHVLNGLAGMINLGHCDVC